MKNTFIRCRKVIIELISFPKNNFIDYKSFSYKSFMLSYFSSFLISSNFNINDFYFSKNVYFLI